MKIFFDFDGTLVDSKERLYRLFQHIVVESKLTFNEYWELKRNKISHKDILTSNFSYTKQKYDLFVNDWMNKIELPQWLSFDKPFEGVTEFLARINSRHTLYVITARQSTNRVLQQIESYKWTKFFEQVFVTNQRKDKSDLLNNLVIENTDWMIGDTGHDVETGKKLGMKTAAVLSGFLNREKLAEYNPDIILNSIQDFTGE